MLKGNPSLDATGDSVTLNPRTVIPQPRANEGPHDQYADERSLDHGHHRKEEGQSSRQKKGHRKAPKAKQSKASETLYSARDVGRRQRRRDLRHRPVHPAVSMMALHSALFLCITRSACLHPAEIDASFGGLHEAILSAGHHGAGEVVVMH